jgi:Mn2+/Fe2+ NRAMP family transporter
VHSTSRQDDRAILERAHARGGLAVPLAYLRLSGPGWLGSAFTLGAGSLAGSLFLGVIGGYSLLWVQPLAMLLGVIMLGAISHVALSLESSPFAAIRRQINPVLAWSWLLGALVCNMVWSFPQYSLAYGALAHNLFPGLLSGSDSTAAKLLLSLAILLLVGLLTFGYGGKSGGIRIYELVLKLLVAVIVIAFFGVVIRLALTGRLPLGDLAAGFMPRWSNLFAPADAVAEVLNRIRDPLVREYWTQRIVDAQRERMVAAASSTVAVNMCFLVPFSLLAKGWTRSFRGLALFDLATGTFVPFVLATGCVVIAAASQFHGKVYDGIVLHQDGTMTIAEEVQDPRDVRRLQVKIDSVQESLDTRQASEGLGSTPVETAETRVALMLLPRDNYELAESLAGLFNDSIVVQKIFGVGVLAMALSTISILMLISGFALCEALEVPHQGFVFRLGAMFPAVGVIWPLVWGSRSGAYLAVAAATVGFTLLPMAYVTFAVMMNSRRLLGGDLPRGGRRLLWNLLMAAALVICGGASIWTAWNLKLANVPLGRWALAAFGTAILSGQMFMKRRQAGFKE